MRSRRRRRRSIARLTKYARRDATALSALSRGTHFTQATFAIRERTRICTQPVAVSNRLIITILTMRSRRCQSPRRRMANRRCVVHANATGMRFMHIRKQGLIDIRDRSREHRRCETARARCDIVPLATYKVLARIRINVIPRYYSDRHRARHCRAMSVE